MTIHINQRFHKQLQVSPQSVLGGWGTSTCSWVAWWGEDPDSPDGRTAGSNHRGWEDLCDNSCRKTQCQIMMQWLSVVYFLLVTENLNEILPSTGLIWLFDKKKTSVCHTEQHKFYWLRDVRTVSNSLVALKAQFGRQGHQSIVQLVGLFLLRSFSISITFVHCKNNKEISKVNN